MKGREQNGRRHPAYVHKDNMGSWVAISNNKDNVVKEQNFDAWGRHRNPDDWTYNNVSNDFPFERGYTGHEHLNQFNLVNMNS